MTKFRYLMIPAVFALNITACSEAPDPGFAGSGTIEATEVTISARTTGTLLAFPVDEGSRVIEGDLIASIDVEPLELQRAVSEADLADIDWSGRVLETQQRIMAEQVSQASLKQAFAEKTKERIANLYQAGAATADRLDAVDTELAVGIAALNSTELQREEIDIRLSALAAKRQKVNASLALLERQIADGTVTTSRSGIVLETYVEEGELATTGKPLCTIADMDTVTLCIYVGEEDLGTLSLGDSAGISVDSHPNERFNGRITWISPEAEFTPKNVQTRDARADLVYAVEITIPNPDGLFKIGMPADAYLEELDSE